jgi:regulator of RNase E activity RraA
MAEAIPIVTKEKLDRLVEFGSTMCLDMLRTAGVYRVYVEGVKPLRPGMKLAGVAVTVRMLPERPDLNAHIATLRERSAEYVAMEKCDEHSVLVFDAMRWQYDSVGGDIKFSRLAHLKARGIVTDASVRDVDSLAEFGLAVFAAGQTAKAGPTNFQPVQERLPVQCGGVLVMPGDILVGDEAGVVVIPRSMLDKVLETAAERVELEAYIKEQLRQTPQSPGRFYPITEQIRQEFLQWKGR